MGDFLLFIIGASVATLSSALLPIPSRELGFVYKNGQGDALVKVGLYIDFTCPDSKASFPTLRQVADYYQPSQFQLRVHAFSLSFHRNSHTISKATYFLSTYQSPKNATVYDWLQVVYDNLDLLSTAATVNQTDVEVLDFLASLAYNVTGVSNDDFKAAVHNTNIDELTRLDWKYGITRSVVGTPSFTVNDVFVDAQPTWTPSQWTTLIDGLIGN